MAKENWFERHKILGTIFIIIGAIILVSILVGVFSPKESQQANNQSNQGVVTSSAQQQNQTIPQIQPTTVQTIGTVLLTGANWQSTAGVSGLEFYLDPKDSNDNSVSTDGKISATLWKEKLVNYQYQCLKQQNDLLDQWSNISVSRANFGFMGVQVRLQYNYYKPTSDTSVEGCALVTFTTPDGKTFQSEDDDVLVNYAFPS